MCPIISLSKNKFAACIFLTAQKSPRRAVYGFSVPSELRFQSVMKGAKVTHTHKRSRIRTPSRMMSSPFAERALQNPSYCNCSARNDLSTARDSSPEEIWASKNAFRNRPFCRDNFYREKKYSFYFYYVHALTACITKRQGGGALRESLHPFIDRKV